MYSAPETITSSCKLLYTLNLCDVFHRPDSQVPWLILTPRREELFEIHQLTQLEQQILWEEVNQISLQLNHLICVDKINIAALGNIEPRLHIHIIGRSKNDRAWPKAIWDIPDQHPETPLKFELPQQRLNKELIYQTILKQFSSLVDSSNPMANMAILNSLLHEKFKHNWIGFYLYDESSDLLKLAPYIGPLPCLTIKNGRGVCGTSFKTNKALVVGDVHQFNDHIACSQYSNSEIVIPFKNQQLSGVLDIDSLAYHNFDQLDVLYLERLVSLL